MAITAINVDEQKIQQYEEYVQSIQLFLIAAVFNNACAL